MRRIALTFITAAAAFFGILVSSPTAGQVQEHHVTVKVTAVRQSTTTTEPLASVTTTTAPPAVVPVPAPAPLPAPVAQGYGGYQPGLDDPITTLSADVQQAFACIRWRESHGDPVAHNPYSTAAGLYQFLTTSWIAYGGGQFAPTADLATPQQQGQVAVWAYQQSGLSPWGGGC